MDEFFGESSCTPDHCLLGNSISLFLVFFFSMACNRIDGKNEFLVNLDVPRIITEWKLNIIICGESVRDRNVLMQIISFSLNLDAFKIIIGLFDSMETEFFFVGKNKCIEMISFLALLDVTSIIIGLGDRMIFKSHYMGYYFSKGQLSWPRTTVCTRRLRIRNCTTILGPQGIYLAPPGPVGIILFQRAGTPYKTKKDKSIWVTMVP